MSRTLRPFLPRHLVEALGRDGLPTANRIARRRAALLCVDVVGFTALTERLEQRGREGAEEIARLVKDTFREPIRRIDELGGSIVSFGGDAIFAVFLGPGGDGRALLASRRLADSLAPPRPGSGRPPIVVSQAVAAGTLHEVHLEAEGVRHLVVSGPATFRLASMLRQAAPGTTVLSPALRALRIPADPPAAPALPEVEEGLLRRYLDPRIAPVLHGFRGASRVAAVLFLQSRSTAGAHSGRALASFFPRLRRALDAFEGVLLKTDLSPDGVSWLCGFGIPAAHEEDPERAARAALELIARSRPTLQLRAGLHVGPLVNVIVGSPRRMSLDVMGDVVNTAARACSLARWGEVLATQTTMGFLSGVEGEDRGCHAVRGKAEPLHVHQLRPARGVRRAPRLGVPMIGRELELGRIAALLERARAGGGGALSVTGDAGTGKSRLKYEASLLARGMGFEVHEGRSPSIGGVAYACIAELLRDALGPSPATRRGATASRTLAACRRLGLGAVDRAHIVALLDSGAGGMAAELAGGLAPAEVRTNTMVAVAAAFRALARNAPRLLVLEDLHWADEPSLQAAAWLASSSRESRLLVLAIGRGAPALPAGFPEIALGELGEHETSALLAASLGAAPEGIVDLVRKQAGGNPFYVEEVARHLVEAGVVRRDAASGVTMLRELRRGELPGSVELLIAARLDRLEPDVRRAAQLGAVIGRTFRRGMLAKLAGSALRIDRVLDRLAALELVFPAKQVPGTYVFKHALTRDVAYASLLATERMRLHGIVARTLVREPRLGVDAAIATVGHHWEQAGDRARAGVCYFRAARQAETKAEPVSMESHARRAVELLDASSVRRVEATILLASALLERGSVPEQERAVDAAFEAATRLGDRAMVARALNVRSRALHRRGLAEAAIGPATAALELWSRLGRRLERARLKMHLSVLHRDLGRAAESRRHALGALALLSGTRHRAQRARAEHALANLDFMQGRYEEAAARYLRASRFAAMIRDRNLRALIRCNAGLLEMERGQLPEARAHLEFALRVVRSSGSRRSEGQVLGNLGLLADYEGSLEEAERHQQAALAIHRELRNRRGEGVTLGNLANLRLQAGAVAEAEALSRAAILIHRELGNRAFEGHEQQNLAEALRLKGEGDAAEGHLQAALAIVGEVGDKLDVAKVRCRVGVVKLFQGRSARSDLARARRLARELGIPTTGAGAELSKDLERLARAQERFENGLPLLRGLAPEDLTEGQRRFVAEHEGRAAR